MVATGKEVVTLEQLKSWGNSVLNGGGARCLSCRFHIYER